METKNMDQKDEHLWRLAKKRIAFRNHLISYLGCSAFFWALWFFTDYKDPESGFPWPLIVMASWGFGIFWHFLGVFVFSGTGKKDAIEQEYERLKRKREANG